MQCGLFAEHLQRQIHGVSWTWCNGEFIEGPLAISPVDRGLTHGLGLFETLLALNGRPVALEMHLERMRTGAELLRWQPFDFGTVRMEEAIAGLLRRAGLDHGRARVRIAMSGGEGDLRVVDKGKESRLWITATTAPPPPESITLVTSPFPRNEASPLSGIKCASYAENLLALDHARRNGADEALFYNTKGELCEATTSNVFLVREGKALTPPLSSGCLPGTMRARVISLCRELKIPLEEALLTRSDVAAAEEIFVTSSTRGVVPVEKLDRHALPECPGRLTAILRSAIG